jgi:mycofactocin precursor
MGNVRTDPVGGIVSNPRDPQPTAAPTQIDEDVQVLVEDVSIDGMCGVY